MKFLEVYHRRYITRPKIATEPYRLANGLNKATCGATALTILLITLSFLQVSSRHVLEQAISGQSNTSLPVTCEL